MIYWPQYIVEGFIDRLLSDTRHTDYRGLDQFEDCLAMERIPKEAPPEVESYIFCFSSILSALSFYVKSLDIL